MKQLSMRDDSKYSYYEGKRIFIGINMLRVLVTILKGVISSA